MAARGRLWALVGGVGLIAAPLQAQVFNGGIPAGYTCVGTCSTSAAVGDLTLAPTGGTAFGYVTSLNGPNGGANQLGIAGTTNGSTLTSGVFTATAGQNLSFAFNFITTDGTAAFTDYGFVRLLGSVGGPVILFTARTNPTAGGNTVPGFGLPGLAPGVTLSPASTPIIPGAPTASAAILGGHNGQCFGPGCGFTDWVLASYNIPVAGNYQLEFGVTNVGDTAWDTALAFDFNTGSGGVPTVSPEPATLALTAGGLLALGAFARRRKA